MSVIVSPSLLAADFMRIAPKRVKIRKINSHIISSSLKEFYIESNNAFEISAY